MKDTLSRAAWSRIFGFLIFIVFLGIANFLAAQIHNEIFSEVVVFFDSNLSLLFLMMIFGLVSDLFWSMDFPFNLLAPPFSAVLGVLIVMFIQRGWLLFQGVFPFMTVSFSALYVLVVLLVLVIGYLRIAFKVKSEGFDMKKKVEWDDVGEEFKLALYNLGKALNRAFEGSPKKTKKR